MKIEIKTQYTVGFSEMYIIYTFICRFKHIMFKSANECMYSICMCLSVSMDTYKCICSCVGFYLTGCKGMFFGGFVFIFGPCGSSLCQAGLINFPLNCMVCPLKTLKAFKHLCGEAPASS